MKKDDRRLEEYVVENGVTEIGNDTFRNKKSLKRIKFPNSLERIGANAFACSGLGQVEIPVNVSSISVSPFSYCTNLEEINVSDKNQWFCSVDGVLYTKNMSELKEYPSGNKQERFTIPEGVTTIADRAFAGCKYLLKVELPYSMTIITSRAFQNCKSLQEVVVPDSVTRIERQAFAYCPELKKVILPKGIYVEHGAFGGSDNVSIDINSIDETPKNLNLDFKIQQIKKTDIEEPNQIILSEKLKEASVFTTETKHIFSAECGRNIYGEEEIDEIVELGTKVRPFDMLIHRRTPKKPSTPEARLLNTMFGEKFKEYSDTSLCVPFNVHGEVIDVKKNDLGSVSVTVLQKFPLSVGDVLVDENGNEGVVVSFSSNLEKNEIVANFELGAKIAKKSIAEHAVQMRSTGECSLSGYPIPTKFYYGELSHVVYGIPQSLHSQDITKLIRNDFTDVLKNVVALQTNQIKNRFEFYNKIVKGQLTDAIKLPFNDINTVCCFLKALCLKPVFRDENGKEIPFFYTDKNYELNKAYCENLSFEIGELSDDEIRQMSYGEVVNSETINYRTQQPEKGGLLCETIFGPKKDFECQCGKYRGKCYNRQVCDRCGVEITNWDVRYERFGHIELAKLIPHPFIPNRMLSVIPVLPPELRPMVPIGGGRYVTSDLNDLYNSVVTRNKHLKNLNKYDSPDIVIKNEAQRLQESINNLFGYINEDDIAKNSNNSQTTLIDKVSQFFTQNLKYVSLDYSATCNVIVDNSPTDEQCGLPLRIALELFKPFLINQLREKGIVANLRDGRQLILAVSNERNIEKKAIVIEMLQDIMSSKKILIFSKDIDGKVLSLFPVIVELSVLTLNFNQYKMLKPQLDETIKIILPASDSVQAMLNNKNDFNSKQITNIFDCEDNTDFVKTLTIASLENINIIPLLLDVVKNHEICNFNTVTSQYVFGKPSKWACDFYKQPPIEDEQNEEEKSKENKLEKTNNNDTKIDEIFVDLFSNDTELENLDDFTFDDLLGFDNIDNPSGDDSISTGNLFDISENSSQD